MKNSLLLLLVCTLMTGCFSQRSITWTKKGNVPAGSKIAVVTPADGVYIDEHYPQSGMGAARKLTGALAAYYPGSETVTGSGSGFPYVIKPELTHWEERATEWSAKPDRVTVTLPVYDRSGGLVAAAVVKAKSSYWTLGGDHPEDLVDAPFEIFAARLAGVSKSNKLVIEK